LTPRQIADRLDDRFRLLTGGGRTALPRQRTLEAAVSWSYDLLDDAERAVFRRLAVFAGTFDLPAAEAVCDGDILDVLGRLVDKSLVVTALGGDRIRYRLLETVRYYGWNKLLDAGEVEQTRALHLRHFVDMAEANLPGLFDAREMRATAALSDEQPNVRTALEWAIDRGDTQLAHQLAGASWMYWSMRGAVAEGLTWVTRVLAMPDSADAKADPDSVARTYAGHAHLAAIAAAPRAQVTAAAQPVIARMRERGDTPRWYEVWAMMMIEHGDEATGDRTAPGPTDAMIAARACGNATIITNTVLVHGFNLVANGLAQEALGVFEEALDTAKTSGSAATIAYALESMANLAAGNGDIGRARTWADEAVAAARRCPNVFFLMFALRAAGRCSHMSGDTNAASIAFGEWLELARGAGIDHQMGEARLNLAAIEMELGRLDDARQGFRDARAALARVAANRQDIMLLAARAGQGIGEVDLLSGDYQHAGTVFARGAAFADTLGLGWVLAYTANSLGWLAQAEGDYPAARGHHQRALAAALDDDHSPRFRRAALGGTLRGIAAVTLAEGDATLATRLSAAAAVVPEPNEASPLFTKLLHARALRTCRDNLGEPSFADAWAAGERWLLEQAAADALA
ncbi:MAG: hypothetical protein H0U92_09100, partial [Actinobacteria bacterium]|nr:hypothetical protein [Actinomycetota bacterium]